MKIFKLLFSKIFISALALYVQFGIIISFLVFYGYYFVFLQIIGYIFALLVLLGIINKRESPEFKLPWLVIVLLLPLYGTTVYCMFANSNMPQRQFRRMIESSCRCKKFSELTSSENDKLYSFLGEYSGIESYLRKNSFSRGHLNNEVKYFSSGEQFFADLVEELEKAEKFIFMEYFVIDHGKMWDTIHGVLKKKVAEGVEVRVMYDDIGSAGLLKSNYFRQLAREGINCRKFNPFRPIMSGIHNNRDHRKITVIDGKTAYTGGVNLADEYINEKPRFGHWKDTSVKIRGSAAGNLTALFLQLFDADSKKLSDYGKYFPGDYGQYPDGGYIHPFGDGPRPFYQERVGSNNFINIINAAKHYVYITTPYLIPDYYLTCALRSAAFRGVDVRIITPHVPDKKIIFNMTRSNYKYLMQSGVKIYEYTPGFIHAKGMVSDDVAAFVGTINLDYRSLVHHYECGAVMYKTPCIADIKRDFDETLIKSHEITETNFKMGFFASLLNAVLNLFSPML